MLLFLHHLSRNLVFIQSFQVNHSRGRQVWQPSLVSRASSDHNILVMECHQEMFSRPLAVMCLASNRTPTEQLHSNPRCRRSQVSLPQIFCKRADKAVTDSVELLASINNQAHCNSNYHLSSSNKRTGRQARCLRISHNLQGSGRHPQCHQRVKLAWTLTTSPLSDPRQRITRQVVAIMVRLRVQQQATPVRRGRGCC